MIWDNIKNSIKQIFSKPNNNEWLNRRFAELENLRLKQTNLPFKIIDIKETGFIVKVAGLHAFVSFNHLFWIYGDYNFWKAIYPELIGKVFYGRIYDLKLSDHLFILLDAKIPQFKKTELTEGNSYRGIIVGKIYCGVFVETGYHFEWRYGSFPGFMRKSQFKSRDLFTSCSVGDKIEVFYQGKNESGQLEYSETNELLDWKDEIPQSLVGQKILARAVREESKFALLVNDKYRGRIDGSKTICINGIDRSVNRYRRKLKDGDMIHCEVTGFSNEERTLELTWLIEHDWEFMKNNRLPPRLSIEIKPTFADIYDLRNTDDVSTDN